MRTYTRFTIKGSVSTVSVYTRYLWIAIALWPIIKISIHAITVWVRFVCVHDVGERQWYVIRCTFTRDDEAGSNVMEVAVKAVERRSLLHLASRTNRSSTCCAHDSLCKVILLIVRFVLLGVLFFRRVVAFVSRSFAWLRDKCVPVSGILQSGLNDRGTDMVVFGNRAIL